MSMETEDLVDGFLQECTQVTSGRLYSKRRRRVPLLGQRVAPKTTPTTFARWPLAFDNIKDVPTAVQLIGFRGPNAVDHFDFVCEHDVGISRL